MMEVFRQAAASDLRQMKINNIYIGLGPLSYIPMILHMMTTSDSLWNIL